MQRVALRYKVVKQLGDGTYGAVWKAINRQTSEVVSVKRAVRPGAACSEHTDSGRKCIRLLTRQTAALPDFGTKQHMHPLAACLHSLTLEANSNRQPAPERVTLLLHATPFMQLMQHLSAVHMLCLNANRHAYPVSFHDTTCTVLPAFQLVLYCHT